MPPYHIRFSIYLAFVATLTVPVAGAKAERERDTIDRAIASPDDSTTRPTASAGRSVPVWTVVLSAKLATSEGTLGSTAILSRVVPVPGFDVEVSLSGSGSDLTGNDERTGDVGAAIAIAKTWKGSPWSQEVGIEPGLSVSNAGSVSGSLPVPFKAHHQARGTVATMVTIGVEPALTFADGLGWEVAPSASVRRILGHGWTLGVGARGAVSAESFGGAAQAAAKVESKVSYKAASERTMSGVLQFGPSDLSAATKSLTITVKVIATF